MDLFTHILNIPDIKGILWDFWQNIEKQSKMRKDGIIHFQKDGMILNKKHQWKNLKIEKHFVPIGFFERKNFPKKLGFKI